MNTSHDLNQAIHSGWEAMCQPEFQQVRFADAEEHGTLAQTLGEHFQGNSTTTGGYPDLERQVPGRP